MRTKALLLTAAITVAGLATASAAVYSVNAVGYINVTVAAGTFQIVANQLDNGTGNDVRDILPGVDGLTVYKWTGAGYDILNYDGLDEAWLPAGTTITMNPGEAAFLKAPPGADTQITFVGEVMQGNLNVAYPGGGVFAMISSIVPQEGGLDVLGFTAQDGDTVYQYDPTISDYVISNYDGLDEAWLPGGTPTIKVGEGFFLKSVSGGTWTRDFDINQ